MVESVQADKSRISSHSKQVRRDDPRTFWSLIGVMFQGAFSDNVYKLILMFLVVDLANRTHAGDAEAASSHASLLIGVVGAAFALPWIFFVSVSGWLSDRFSKARVTQGTKVMEIGVMCLATIAFALGSVWMGIVVLVLMSLQSALFSPSKYGILPEILPDRRVAWGNGILQGFTFLAILIGTLIAPMLKETFREVLWINGLLLLALAIVGFVTSAAMRPIPAANPGERLRANPFAVVRRYGRDIMGHVGLRWAVAGAVAFAVVSATLQADAVNVIKTQLFVPDRFAGFALVPIVIGIGAGCFLVSVLSRDRTELGLVPFGALGAFLSSVLMWWLAPPVGIDPESTNMVFYQWSVPLAMGLMSFFCGIFIVPLQSFILQSSNDKVRGGVWAVTNLLSACGWLVGPGLLLPVVTTLRGNPSDVFLACGVIMLLICLVMCWRFPHIPLRFMITCFVAPFYRIRVNGIRNFPEEGGALLIANHQSYLDGLLIATLSPRPVRFIMSERIYKTWFIYPFARLTNSIPIHFAQSPRDLIKSLRIATDEIRGGGFAGIFPEGQMTRIGMMMPFRQGAARIMKDLDEPIIPIAIDGLYESRWALPWGKRRMFRHLVPRRGRINVAIGEPMPSNAPLWQLRQAISELMVDAVDFRREDARPLHREVIHKLRERPLARLYGDHSTDGPLRNVKLLAGMVLLGNRMRPIWEKEENVGFLIPPSVGTMLLNQAALAAGKTVVNINYSASPEIIQLICDDAGIRVLITSKEFLKKANLGLPEVATIVYTEDLRRGITKSEQLAAMLRGLFMPIVFLEKYLGRTRRGHIDDTATIVYSSGSTGIPKGAMLSHWNIWSDCHGTLQYLDFGEDGRLLGALPFFHSFGFMAGMMLPLMGGISIAFYPNPLDGRAIGDMVEKYRVTHLFATPTFLATYIRRVDPAHFGSLRFVLTGAEKLRDYIADGFEERFGLRPIEGFGCTELSPVVSLNTDNFRASGVFQRGTHYGTVGHPIAGVAVRVVDLDSGELLPPGKSGMLLVKGPNVMLGYYKLEDKTNEVMRDGWYITGDVARLDENGFVSITDRLSRFSKIGGEMVPHLRIEEFLRQAADTDEMQYAVTGLPDEKRGERLVVLYTVSEEEAKSVYDRLAQPDSGLPKLWTPRWQDFIQVEEIPILGSGKLDLKKIKAIAEERLRDATA